MTIHALFPYLCLAILAGVHAWSAFRGATQELRDRSALMMNVYIAALLVVGATGGIGGGS